MNGPPTEPPFFNFFFHHPASTPSGTTQLSQREVACRLEFATNGKEKSK